MSGAILEGMSPEGAARLLDYMLSAREFFVLAFAEAAAIDPATENAILLELEACQAVTIGRLQGSQQVDPLAMQMFDCLGRNTEFRYVFEEEATYALVAEGISQEAAAATVDLMLQISEFFVLTMREAARDDHLFLWDMEASLAECEMVRGTIPSAERDLDTYAEKHAGGPGAIYVGNLEQLVGPAPSPELGDRNGNVSLSALQDHQWLYESDYYQSLLQRAKLSNPARLVSRGHQIEIVYYCINRALLTCSLIDQYLKPNLEARTNGQLLLKISSVPELGVAGPDTLPLLSDGTLDMSHIFNGYIAAALPSAEAFSLWGIYPDGKTAYLSNSSMIPKMDAILSEATNGGVVVNHNWLNLNDVYIFSKKPLMTSADFEQQRMRSYAAALSDWLDGMGAVASFLSFIEVYASLEHDRFDAAVTNATAAYEQRWYEVIDYMNGPLVSWLPTTNVVNKEVWQSMPQDLQQILIEEGAKAELEQLRLAAVQSTGGLEENIDVGLKLVEFPPQVKHYAFNIAAIQHVIPGWLRRMGYPRRGDEGVDMFNEHVGPYVGLQIRSNGAVEKIPITAGPHVGKTMEEVLAE